MLSEVVDPLPDSEDNFGGEEYDNLYFTIMDLMQDGLCLSEILDVLQDRWQPQIERLKSHGYLGG